MRVLYFSRNFTSHDYRFLTAMAKTEHRIYCLHLDGGGQVLEERPLPPEIEIVDWAGGTQPARFRDGLRLLDDLHRVIRQVKPDLVQAGPIQRSALLVAMAGFHPLVSMSWGYDLLHDARRNSFWGWATRYTLAHSDALLGDCNTIRKLAIFYGMDKDRIVTFPWGIELQHFNIPAFQRANDQTFSLLSTRSFEPIYGIDVIARAFVIAAHKRGELKLVMLGGGSQWAAIRQILLVGGVFDRVEFPGIVPFADLPRYHQEADVYVCASHSDGTSISLLEAFACGTPAIVSDIPGNQEWITEGENGWLFPDGNAQALASTILRSIEQRQNLPEMGINARQVAESRADWEKNFPQLEKAYALARNHHATLL
jgi:glycosyltransferase involved in cell wall biosynthesis